MRLSSSQRAFDASIKAQNNFDYRGIADLDHLRKGEPALSPLIEQLIEVRDAFNAALAVEGQHIVGDAPHSPFYLDYVDSTVSNALAFHDADHSFIGVTVPLVFDISKLANRVSSSQAVVSGIGLSPSVDREVLQLLLFWMLLGFIVSHEYAHHTHGHFSGAFDDGAEVAEITGGALSGRLRRQALEADADGWASYLTLNHWVLAGGRDALLKLLQLEDATVTVQDDVAFACFVVAQAAFTFLREPEPLTGDTVYWRTHPPQPVRLHLMSRYVLKFSSEFRPGLRDTMTQPRYQALMNSVSQLMWTGEGQHAARWREQGEFLRSAEGAVYQAALIAELDAFRASLRLRVHQTE